MKTTIVSILSLILTLTTAFAQQTVCWKGGTPGRETSWNEARNWSTYQVPDEDAHVVIPFLHTGHYAQPVIDELVEVASIRLQAGATLTVTFQGELVVDGSQAYSEGIVNQGGSLINEGLIQLFGIENSYPGKIRVENKDSGMVLLNGQPLEKTGFAKK